MSLYSSFKPQFTGVTSLHAGTDTAVSSSIGIITVWNTSTLQTVTNRGAVTTNAITINSNTNAITTTSGALVVQGGAGIGRDLFIGGVLTVEGMGNFSSNGVTIGNTLVSSYTSDSITSISTQNLDTFIASAYRSAKYTIQIVDSAKVHITEMMIFHDDTAVYKMEYGITSNTGELGSFDASILAGVITLTFTPNYIPAAMIINANRISIAT